MTLEKLLIFGFAIAAIGALTLSATGTAKQRKTDKDGYQTQVGTMMEQMK